MPVKEEVLTEESIRAERKRDKWQSMGMELPWNDKIDLLLGVIDDLCENRRAFEEECQNCNMPGIVADEFKQKIAQLEEELKEARSVRS